MRKGILLILAGVLLASVALAQPAQKITYFYTGGVPGFATYKTLAPGKACTTDIWVWAWSGSLSNQISVSGRAAKDTVDIESKLYYSNSPAPASWRANSDSIIARDTVIGTAYGKHIDVTNLIPASYGGVIIFTNKDDNDTAKYFNYYPLATPAR